MQWSDYKDRVVTADEQNRTLTNLAAAEVHVWCASADEFQGWQYLDKLLSQSEKDAARRFRKPEDGQTYILAHGLLRHILGRYLGEDPGTLDFSSGEFGKPFLQPNDLAFNLTHSGNRVAIAVARSSVGIDLEQIKIQSVDSCLISTCLTASERHWLEQQTDDPHRGFFRLWTLKEAVLKADGRGLANGCHAAMLLMKPHGIEATAVLDGVVWTAYELEAGSKFCLAVAGQNVQRVRLALVRLIDRQGDLLWVQGSDVRACAKLRW